jgi:hypothetical protein
MDFDAKFLSKMRLKNIRGKSARDPPSRDRLHVLQEEGENHAQ